MRNSKLDFKQEQEKTPESKLTKFKNAPRTEENEILQEETKQQREKQREIIKHQRLMLKVFTLDFNDCRNLSSLVLLCIKNQLFYGIKELKLRNTDITNEALRIINKSQDLRHNLNCLDLTKCQKITSAGFQQFFENYKFENLQIL